MVASGNTGPPGEGWKESSVTQLPLVTWQVDMAPILEGRPQVDAMLEDTLSPSLRGNAMFKSAETAQSSEGKLQLGMTLSVERYNCVSSCVV